MIEGIVITLVSLGLPGLAFLAYKQNETFRFIAVSTWIVGGGLVALMLMISISPVLAVAKEEAGEFYSTYTITGPAFDFLKTVFISSCVWVALSLVLALLWGLSKEKLESAAKSDD